MYTVVLMAALTSGPATTGQALPGVRQAAACRGCFGCYGGYSGSGYNYMVGHGSWSAFSVYAPVVGANVFGCQGCYGCYGGWSCYGVPRPSHGTWYQAAPAGVIPPPKTDKIEGTPDPKELPKDEPKDEPKEQLKEPKEKKTDEQTRARLTIDVPLDARVYLDGEPLKAPVATRVFLTPALNPGSTYFYDLRAEIERDGRTLVASQRVFIRAGQTVNAAFPTLRQDATAALRTD
jgi:uncharacterized protein (TIGR03000 family)